MAVRVTDWSPPLEVSVTSSGQTATWESASPQVKCTVTGPAYQPFAFGLVVVAALIVGGGLSSLTGPELVPRFPERSRASPLPSLPAVPWSTKTSGVIVLEST